MPRPPGGPLVSTSGSTVGPPGPPGPAGISAPSGPADLELTMNASDSSTNSAGFARVAGRAVDMTPFIPIFGGLSRHVKFIATLESTTAPVLCSVRLYDVTHSVVVTGTTFDNSGAGDRTLPFEVISADLTVGTGAGNIRSDVVTEYEVQIEMTGGSPVTDRAICVGAHLVITYS